MSTSIRIFRPWLSALLLMLLCAPVSFGAGSIFDDEGWENPAIQGPSSKKGAEPPMKIETRPEAPPAVPEPAAETPVSPSGSNTEAPAAPPRPAPPPVVKEVSPRDMIKLTADRIKAAGAQPAKLSDDSVITLYHQKAVAHAQLGELPAARETMAKVLAAAKTNRSIILNAARIDIAGRTDAMRAAANLEKYMKTVKEPDEDALSLWGMALATHAHFRGSVPDDKVAAFTAAQELVERSRPGEKRWGNKWMDQSDYDKLMRTRDNEMRKITDLQTSFQSELSRFNDYKSRSIRRNRIGQVAGRDPYYFNLMNESDKRLADIKKDLTAAWKKVPKPEWIIPLRMDEPDTKLIAK